jgi:hypothetical protein
MTCDQVLGDRKCDEQAVVVLDPPNLPGITRNLCASHADGRFPVSVLRPIEGIS